MEDAVDEGLVGLLGISNVSVDQLDILLGGARIRPVLCRIAAWHALVGMLRCARYVRRMTSSIKPFPYFPEIGKFS